MDHSKLNNSCSSNVEDSSPIGPQMIIERVIDSKIFTSFSSVSRSSPTPFEKKGKFSPKIPTISTSQKKD